MGSSAKVCTGGCDLIDEGDPMATGINMKSATNRDRALSAADILANSRALGPYLAANGAAIDDARRLPAEVAARSRGGNVPARLLSVSRVGRGRPALEVSPA